MTSGHSSVCESPGGGGGMIWGSGVGYLTSRHSSVCGSPEARKLAKNELGVWGGVLYQWLLQHVCGSPRGGGGGRGGGQSGVVAITR